MSRKIAATLLNARQIGLVLLVLLVSSAIPAHGQTIARCGKGWLETIDGYLVVHVKGTPYEMGYQHGALLKQHIQENLRFLLQQKGATPVKVGPITLYPRAAIETISRYQKDHVPAKYFRELEGLAEGSGLPLADVRMANFLPELFHCSGFAVMDSATADGTLYHGRVLDYSVDWQLQNHAVLVVAEPEGEIPFVNVTFAGFVGSVTGMNERQVSIGEMGGGGFGHWDGVPMAFLVREVLQTAPDLDAAIAVFRDHKRTCEYYYVIADGKTNQAVGMEASWNKFTVLKPGESHPLLPTGVKDAVLLSADQRYKELVKRTQAGLGKLDAEGSMHLMDRGVATQSNLHNVLFAPRSTRLWVANASKDRQPAATQKYQAFQLSELLKRQPDVAAPELPQVAKSP